MGGTAGVITHGIGSPFAVRSATRQAVSRKRGRGSVVRLGVAAGYCSLLVAPVNAGWGFGTVWHPSSAEPRGHENRHASLRHGETTHPRTSSNSHVIHGWVDGFRRLSVEAQLQAAVGEWSPCSVSCTRTRTVLCETVDFKIVPNHLCGDELPAAEEHCEIDACPVATAVAEDAAVSEVGAAAGDSGAPKSKSSTGSRGGQDSTKTPSTSSGNPSTSATAEAGAATTKENKLTAGSQRHSVREPDAHGKGQEDAGVTERAAAAKSNADPNDAVISNPPADQRKGGPSSPAVSGQARTENSEFIPPGGEEKKGQNVDQDGAKNEARSTNATGKGSRQRKEERDGDARRSSPTLAADTEQAGSPEGRADAAAAEGSDAGRSPAEQGESGKSPSPNFATKSMPQGIDRIGGGIGSSGSQRRRSWIVLGIGVTAVGSFLAVLGFAVGQYRKEQHRLRGINALNELPMDNYVNPFCAKEYSDEDRSAFRL